jgi:hypothetical protein
MHIWNYYGCVREVRESELRDYAMLKFNSGVFGIRILVFEFKIVIFEFIINLLILEAIAILVKIF